jgi:hypothetical protein
MGSSNRSSLAYVAEVTKGVTPATPAFKTLRNLGNPFAGVPTRVASAEIRADRQVSNQILTDLVVTGSVNIELSFATYSDFIEAVLQGTWSVKPSITVLTAGTEISAVSTTTLTVAAGGAAFKAGMLVAIAGLPTPANNGLFPVVSSSGTTIVFAAATFTAETLPIPVGASVRVVGFQGASGDVTATTTGLASTTLDFTTLNLNVGENIKTGGDIIASQFATAADNGWARISAITAHAITFGVLPAGWAADAAAAKTIQVFAGDFVTNGVIQRSFTFERQQQDIPAPSFELFQGCEIDQLSLTFKSAALITGSLAVIGRAAPLPTTVRTAGATDIAAPTYPSLNAAGNVGRLTENGALVTTSLFESLGLDIKNNLARETAIGVLGASGIRDGEIAVTGAISAYFNDLNLLTKVLNDVPTSLQVRAGGTTGNRESLLFDIPQVKLTGSAPVSAKNASRMFTGTYDAFMHPVLGYTIGVGRFWYLPASA